MIPKDCKRLAEVDFPIAEVSKHSAREKSIRHGHPSTLHLWWARRPLASSRAVLLALLWPDPCDPLCPDGFKQKARELLPQLQGKVGPTDEDLRKALLKFIADFANWDNAAQRTYLEVSRALMKAAHGEEPPLVVDPFAGGGSIPLEALRLGCDAFASDLNPVACLILKVMIEDIPRHGAKLAEELRRVGAEIKRQAEKELADLYPKDPDGATPIAYLWARTVRCESPNCGAEIPLARTLWLCKKAKRRRALKHRVVRPAGEPPRVEFEIFEPKTEEEVPGGTVTRAKATCVACGAVLPPERVRPQLAAQRGGADVVFDAQGRRTGGARMLAVVTLRPGEQGRHYRLPTEHDYEAIRKAHERVAAILAEWERGGKEGLCPVPDEPTPTGGGSGAGRAFSLQRYGMLQWGDLFTARQKVAMLTVVRHLNVSRCGDEVRRCLGLVLGRCADHWSANAMWIQDLEAVAHTFGRQALPIVWDFVESAGFGPGGASLEGQIDWVARVVDMLGSSGLGRGETQLADACESPLPDDVATVWFTDPPYYDAIPYSDLSDYFFVWHKRALPGEAILQDPYSSSNALTPKDREAVQDEVKKVDGVSKDRHFFERVMSQAFAEGRRKTKPDAVGGVVFAHKTTEGWEALLSGLISAKWTISASWPIATERPVRLRSINSAALATSVHLICRPRPEDAPVGDWADVLRELPKRVGDWMERLQSEGVRGADLVFACIGPALEIYSRYSKVVDPDEKDIPLGGDPEAKEPSKRGFLAYVWETVGRIALGQVLGTTEAHVRSGMAEELEEDARLTALFLWTLQATGSEEESEAGEGAREEGDDEADEESPAKKKKKGYALIFDVARRFAQPLGIELPKWEGRIIETEKGVVRLLPVSERAKQLFGEDGAEAVARQLERDPVQALQQSLFPELDIEPVPHIRGRKKGRIVGASATEPELKRDREATTLDRVHAAMLLQAGGQANALRTLIKAEQERGPDFLRLANALSALYPKKSEEKRLLDAMLLAVQR